MAWMASVLALAAVAYFGSKLWAKPAPAGSPAPTRIALLNLRLVIKKYDRYQAFIAEIKATEKTYVEKLQAKQNEAEAAGKQGDTTGVERIQKEAEEIKVEARKKVAGTANEQMVIVYRDVREAAARYAKEHNIDLVLHFEGPAEKDEVDSPTLVTRNMNAGGCVPLFWNPDLDISEPVLDALNKSYKRSK
jgi:Skp family chaperone for outer membrane proteins